MKVSRHGQYKTQNADFFISVTAQRYEINILPESIIVGNDALFKCAIPSFVSDFVSVDAWIDSESNSVKSQFDGIRCFLVTDNMTDDTDSVKDYVTN